MADRSIDLMTLADKLADETELEFAGEKFTGAELKQYFGGQREQFKQREQELEAERNAHRDTARRYQEFENSTGQLLRQAASAAALETQNGGHQAAPTAAAADPEWERFANDPLYGDYSKVFKRQLLSEVDANLVKPLVQNQLSPILQNFQRQQMASQQMQIDLKQRLDYRDMGEWPDKFDLNQARRYGAEHAYFEPDTVYRDQNTGQLMGVVDIRRVHQEVMAPTFQSRREAEKEKEITERVTRELRQSANVIQMPNRAMGGLPAPKAKGKTPDEIFGHALNEAANDNDTIRQLNQLRGV